MKLSITLIVLFIATLSLAQRANKKSTNYEKQIIGTWYETDNYGFKTDKRGNTTWGLTEHIDTLCYEFDEETVTITDLKTKERSTFDYSIRNEILTIDEVEFFIAYINDEYQELMLFGGDQNADHYKLNRSIGKKSNDCIESKE